MTPEQTYRKRLAASVIVNKHARAVAALESYRAAMETYATFDPTFARHVDAIQQAQRLIASTEGGAQ